MFWFVSLKFQCAMDKMTHLFSLFVCRRSRTSEEGQRHVHLSTSRFYLVYQSRITQANKQKVTSCVEGCLLHGMTTMGAS